MRPAFFQVGGVLYWVIQTRNPDTMVLKDADSTPTVAVRKNGSSVADSVTVTKRSATTGIYDCSYNPAGEVEGDAFTLEESATVTGTTTSSATYNFAWNVRCVAVERGTDSANTSTPPTVGAIADAVWDEARSGHTTVGTFGEKVNAELDPTVEANISSAASNSLAVASRLTTQRAANLDNLDVAMSVVQSQITALNNLSAKANWFGSLLLEVPDSSTRAYVFELVVKDDEDKLVNLDGLPTIALVNAAGTDRSSLITTGIANPSTGRYTLTVTVGTGTVNESLKLTASGTVSGEARYAVIAPQVVDYDNATQVALLLTRLGTPSVSVSADIAAVSTKLGTPAGASVSADIASVKTDATTLLGRITSNVYTMFLDLIAMITGSGTSDAGWDTAALSRAPSGGSSSPTTLVSTTIDTVTSQTVFTLTAGAPDNDVYNDMMAIITDASTSTQKAKVQVIDYVASTKTLTLSAAPGFTVASGDSIAIIAVQNLTAAQNSRLSLLGAGTRQTVKSDSGASIELKIGDDYVASIGTAKRIEINDVDGAIYDDIRTASHTARSFGFGYIKAGAKSSDVVTGTIDRATVTYTPAAGSVKAYTTIFVEMAVASTLAAGSGKYDIQVTHSNGKKQTLFSGDCELVTDYKS